MKNALIGLIWTVFVGTLLVGCATASSAVIVTGTVRAPVDVGTVRIVSAMPENCEVIAMVKASSDVGFTEQQCYDYAIEELKKRTASIGGNAVLIENMGSRTEAYFYSNNHIIPYDEHFITGKALYIPSP
jgi:hypothetical protein